MTPGLSPKKYLQQVYLEVKQQLGKPPNRVEFFFYGKCTKTNFLKGYRHYARLQMDCGDTPIYSKHLKRKKKPGKKSIK